MLLACSCAPVLAVALLSLVNAGGPAAPTPTIDLFVSAKSGDDLANDCLDRNHPCATIQHAVDEATRGGTIHVASGIYDDVHERDGKTQVVYLDRSLTIRGGYAEDFSRPDPRGSRTTLDAKGSGRVFYITGEVTPTLEALSMTGGTADRGGGLYAVRAHPVIDGCRIYSNTASIGGGAYFNLTDRVEVKESEICDNQAGGAGGILVRDANEVVLSGNEIHDNHADGSAPGIEITESDRVTVTRNRVYGNTGDHTGGGLKMDTCESVTVADNEIYQNELRLGSGGGIYLEYCDPEVTLTGNQIYENRADHRGGGLFAGYAPHVSLVDNRICDNTAARGDGGGVFLSTVDAALVNNVVAGNQISGTADGAGLWLGGSARLMHTTIAANGGGHGQGVYAASVGRRVALTNTILVGHQVGIAVNPGGSEAFLEATLWGSGAWANGEDWGSEGTIETGTVNVWGDPGFVAPETDDYHITFASAAAGVGVDAGVGLDIDGAARPQPSGTRPDLGAHEVHQRRAFLPVVLLGGP
jgi:parallel beta-helix repeat protein